MDHSRFSVVYFPIYALIYHNLFPCLIFVAMYYLLTMFRISVVMCNLVSLSLIFVAMYHSLTMFRISVVMCNLVSLSLIFVAMYHSQSLSLMLAMFGHGNYHSPSFSLIFLFADLAGSFARCKLGDMFCTGCIFDTPCTSCMSCTEPFLWYPCRRYIFYPLWVWYWTLELYLWAGLWDFPHYFCFRWFPANWIFGSMFYTACMHCSHTLYKLHVRHWTISRIFSHTLHFLSTLGLRL